MGIAGLESPSKASAPACRAELQAGHAPGPETLKF